MMMGMEMDGGAAVGSRWWCGSFTLGVVLVCVVVDYSCFWLPPFEFRNSYFVYPSEEYVM